MIINREQLLTWIRRNIKDRLIQDSLAEGNVVLFGGFDPLPGGKIAGWIIKVGEQYVCISATRPPRWWQTKTIPWENYVGRTSDNPIVKGEVLHP